MVEVNEIKELIEVLPSVFIYIVPGYLFNLVYNFVRNSMAKDISKRIFEYIFISFIMISIVKFVLGWFYEIVLIVMPEVIISILAVSGVMGFFAAKLTKGKYYNWIVNLLNINRTVGNNMFHDYFEDSEAVWAMIFIKDEKIVYYGQIRGIESREEYNNSFIAISHFIVYKYGRSDLYEGELYTKGEENRFAFIKVEDINRIEVIYTDKSEIFNLLNK